MNVNFNSSFNKCSFGTRIVVSERAFRELPIDELKRAGKYSGYPWGIAESFIAADGYTDEASNCTMVCLMPEKGPKGFLSHLSPTYIEQFEEMETRIREVVKELTELPENRSRKISGILIGGRCQLYSDDYNRSKDLYSRLLYLFKKLHLDFTAILGRLQGDDFEGGHANLYFSVPQKHVVISILPYNTAPRSTRELGSQFDIVHISRNDEIVFAD
ncbi:MAG: hypothetical protein PHC64_04325 [Candidatus Gastranaerophilales bacterium]|nr:hypothetical protein [Candidatus Gastranaerophilales bacterium]